MASAANPKVPISPGDPAPKLGEGDVVEIRVFRETELEGVFRVNHRGEINFPLIGRVGLTGKDSEEVAEEIRGRLADGFLKSPQVTVFVREYNSRKVHVLGQVSKAGSFPFLSGMSIIQAITYAGGLTPLAATNSVKVTRSLQGGEKRFTVRVGDISEGDAPNFRLLPGDIVFVPEAIF